ncbi:hypothetical protein BD779DRAFT_1611603 [Infundibulicybe gibba]|nr:hypothetical protein BD779DRAFT_1611603 [Infundibulicybe gibba]
MFGPLSNPSTFLLMDWFYDGSQLKSLAELDTLVTNVILHKEFDPLELSNFRSSTEVKKLDSFSNPSTGLAFDDAWIEGTVNVPLPCEKVSHQSEDIAPQFKVNKIFYRPPLSIINDAYIHEHKKIHEEYHPQPATPHLETVIAAIMLWSDSTHLTNFGNASLWPIYLFLGNQSKYVRAKMTSLAAHHLAYIPKLSDTFQDFYQEIYGHPATAAVMQLIWLLILDTEFMHAYVHGFEFQFWDGIIHIRLLGTKYDQSRRTRNAREDSEPHGLTLNEHGGGYFIKNGFPLDGFNHFSLYVPDIMHEFDLGVWRATFIHLMRILHAHGNDTIQKLNWRPTFGRNTIRKFSNNASAMKKLGARDYEDLLVVCRLFGSGPLPKPHNDIVLDLLFELATWQSFAKLRLHTETTLRALEDSTFRLGVALRRFQDHTCPFFATKDLPSEEAARVQRKAAQLLKPAASNTTTSHKPTTCADPPGPKLRKFNLSTYKTHALGDYANTIREYGTTDGYSTQIGESEHRRVKRFYQTTWKANYTRGITKQERRQRLLKKIREQYLRSKSQDQKLGAALKTASLEDGNGNNEDNSLPPTRPESHHHISNDRKHRLNIYRWPNEHEGDIAFQDFLPRLLDHLLGRLQGIPYDGDEQIFSTAERAHIHIQNNEIYEHKVLRVNYTTYDMRREQDSINPRTHADIFVLSNEDPKGQTKPHPYWYARVIGIFHAMVQYHPPGATTLERPKPMEFLWVRWFGRDLTHCCGWRRRRLPRIGFLDAAQDGAFGFVDPNLVIRGIHLIPGFPLGYHNHNLISSIARQPSSNLNTDWMYFYIDIFADRDMVMRFRGGGVGHKSCREATDRFLDDRHESESARNKGKHRATGAGNTDQGEDAGEDDVDDSTPETQGAAEDSVIEATDRGVHDGEDEVNENEDEENEDNWFDEQDEFGYHFENPDSDTNSDNSNDEGDGPEDVYGDSDNTSTE